MSAKHGGLGRGLDALIRARPTPEKSAPTEPAEEVLHVPVARIRPAPWQPRRRFDAAALAELVESVRARGVLQPLWVRPVADGYELIAGERRLRAAVEAGLVEVPVRVMAVDDRGAMELALIENLQREDLDPLEEAEGYRQLVEQHGLTQDEIAQRVGRARATIANALRLLTLPTPVRELIEKRELSAGHAKALLGLTIAEEQIALARRAAREGLSVREVERLVARASRPKRARRPAASDVPEAVLRDLTERLQRKLGVAVRLKPSRALADGRRVRGEITIEFYSADDLDRLMVLLGVSDEGL